MSLYIYIKIPYRFFLHLQITSQRTSQFGIQLYLVDIINTIKIVSTKIYQSL